MASCITCFSGTRVLRGERRQSSYSGDALATSPEGQRAILMRTSPQLGCTLRQTRARSDILFSSRQCRANGRGLAKKQIRAAQPTDRDGTARSICTPVRPFFICTADAVNIPRARLQQQLAHIGQQLRSRVVDHRFNHRNAARLPSSPRRLRLRQPAVAAGWARPASRVRPRRSPRLLTRIAGSAA